MQERRPVVYMHVFFGRTGWERIQRTLGSIKIVSKTISKEIDGVVARATRAKPRSVPQEVVNSKYDERLVRDCIRRIGKNTTWTRKFSMSVLGKADNLHIELERLNRKLIILERMSDWYLECEHPDVFHDIKRLPGRRVILRVGDSRMDAIQRKLLDALSAQEDAELLHRASAQGARCHIGISVPQIHKRDFVFLLNNGDRTYEVLVHPVRFREGTDRGRLLPSISRAVPALMQDANQPCNMLPPTAPLSTGFQVSIPSTNVLMDLQFRDPLSTFINNRENDDEVLQVVYPQDQIAIACGLIQGSFHLLGSQWLSFLDCKNIRWRRSAEGRWTTMMAAYPGEGSITRTLDQILEAGTAQRGHRDLTKHCQIFRIGLLLTELALKTPITYIAADGQGSGVKIFIDALGREAQDAYDIASEVETRTNILYGNIVFFCLSVLQDRDLMGNKEIESSYYKDVISQ